jgi:hypothetical protein
MRLIKWNTNEEKNWKRYITKNFAIYKLHLVFEVWGSHFDNYYHLRCDAVESVRELLNNVLEEHSTYNIFRVFQKELYNFERVWTFIQRTCIVFWNVII